MTEFEELYSRYFRDVYRYAYRLCRSESEAEELTQETFFRALKSIDRFHGECRVYVWLCQIAKNLWFTQCARAGRTVPLEDGAESAGAGPLPEDALTDKEQALALHRALHAMEEPYKEVVTLRIFGELPFAQIGELFGKTESWARVTYHRGKLKLKEMSV